LNRSAAKLSYNDAQNVIEGKPLGAVPVVPEHNASDIAHDISILEGLAKKLRAARFENGALSTESLKLAFKLDEATGLPVDCWQYERADANELIEEVNPSDMFSEI
jgi:protein SSD1